MDDDPITLLPKDFGAYNWQIEAESEGSQVNGEYVSDYTWFPENVATATPNPGNMASVDVFHVSYNQDPDVTTGTPPEEDIVRGSVWITSSFYTFDVSELTPETIENATLEIDLSYIWIFVNDVSSSVPGVTDGPAAITQTQTVAADYITGVDDDLATITNAMIAKFEDWPYAGEIGTINLGDFLDPPDIFENGSPGTIQIPISDFGDKIAGADWISIGFTFDTQPSHIWRYQTWEDFDDEGAPFTATYFYNFNDSAFINLENPVTGIRLLINAATAAVDLGRVVFQVGIQMEPAAWVNRTIGGSAAFRLAARGNAQIEVERQILNHQARKQRGY